MRAAIVFTALAALAACTPDVVSGAYLCGPEQSCPDGQVCSGADNTCVLPSQATAFACDPMKEHEPDDTQDHAQQLPTLGCVSTPFAQDDCLAQGDASDWYQFEAPDGCTAVEVVARVLFPVAFEPLDLELWDLSAGTMAAPGAACKQADLGGNTSRCLTFTLTGGHRYGVLVRPAGGGDCGGDCNYNRYQLSVQLQTPG